MKRQYSAYMLCIALLLAVSLFTSSQELAVPMNLAGSAVIPAGLKIYVAPMEDGYDIT